MVEKEKETITKDELSRGLNSVFKRNKKETERIIEEKLQDMRLRVNDNTSDIKDLKSRMVSIEAIVHPMRESVENIKEDVKEIKSDIKDGFKELKEDFKEFKADIKEDYKEIETEVNHITEKYNEHEKRITNAETSKGFLEWIKSTEGIVVSCITTAGPIIVILIQTFNK